MEKTLSFNPSLSLEGQTSLSDRENTEMGDLPKETESLQSLSRSNIYMRDCIHRFTEKPPPEGATSNDPECQCGKKKSDHYVKCPTNAQPKPTWKVKAHTYLSPTNAYGEIKFVGSAGSGQGQQKLRKFVRVENNTPPEILLPLIQKEWNLGQPRFLISVTGGALDFTLNRRLKDLFRRHLIKAALSTGAWIVTGGSNSGVMKYVGEAVRDYSIADEGGAATNVIAIGIATWGVLDQQEALLHPRVEGRRQVLYHMDNPKPKGPRLDPNHTHFILVDDGTTGKLGVEIKLRSKLEKEISHQKVTKDSDERLNVPSVCVVVEGGPSTVQKVYEAINNDIPCLIVAGSGKAADILAYAFKKARSVTKNIRGKNGTKRKETRIKLSGSVSATVEKMLKKEFGEKDVTLQLRQIEQCIAFPEFFNVYELDGLHGVSSDIGSAILHALLKANKGSVIDQLQLALVWKRADVAEREILTNDKSWKKEELYNSVRYAIQHDLHEFLELFIEKGVSMEDYLTSDELTVLYNKIKSTTLLYDLLFKQMKIEPGHAKLNHVGKIIQDLTMDTFQSLYLTDSFDTNRSIENQDDEQADQSKNHFGPIRELFILSILLNRKEMARLLWERIYEALPAALIASKMLKAMASKEDDLNQKEHMMQHADEYEELAIGVLNECYDQEEDRTLIMMQRERPNWGSTTCLTMAVQAQNRKFIAQHVVQNLLTQIWMGKLSDENSYWKLWLCMLCPPAINLAVWFREDERSRKERNPSQSMVAGKDYQPDADQLAESCHMVRDDNDDAPNNEVSNSVPNTGQGEHNKDTAGGDRDRGGWQLTWWKGIKYFYNAPIVKFNFNVLAYFAFLFLFSYIILTDFKPTPISWKEWFLIAWVVTFFAEEFRQVAHGESNSWRHQTLHWISDYWNMVDVATLLLFGVGLGIRFSGLPIGTARIILALDLMLFYMRILQSFSVSKNLGPKLIMIGRMTVDMLFFVCILAVFLIGYGIASYAIMFPNQSSPQKIFTGIFYQAYFQMYGELFLEDIQVEGCTDNQTWNDINDLECPEYSWMGILLLCVYMMLSNVLLLNLLIAMFSSTFSNVQDNTDELWKFQRYEVINEFFGRPPIPPPFIIISHCFFFFRFILKKYCGCCPTWGSIGKLKLCMDPDKMKQLVLWEKINAGKFITKQTQKSQGNMEKRMKVTSDRVQKITMMMEKLSDGEHNGGLRVSKKLKRIDDQLDRIDLAIKWIIDSMDVENMHGMKKGRPKLSGIEPRKQPVVLVDSSSCYEKNDSSYDHDVPSTVEEHGRFHVSDNRVPWEISYPEYNPVSYTHQSVLDMPSSCVDKDLLSVSKKDRPVLSFNQEDTVCNYNRVSHKGAYVVQDGLPLNPNGRTGMIGRGTLRRFGPNHAANPIVTRWKRNQDGEIMKEDDEPILEFIAIRRSDNKQWAIPEGMVEPGHQVSKILLREFSDETLGELDITEEQRKAFQQNVQEFLKNGKPVYKGYVDDPRNTDNAWIETVAKNFHDDAKDAFAEVEDLLQVFAEVEDLLQAGDDAHGLRWQRVSSKIPLFNGHSDMLFMVAEIHKAAF